MHARRGSNAEARSIVVQTSPLLGAVSPPATAPAGAPVRGNFFLGPPDIEVPRSTRSQPMSSASELSPSSAFSPSNERISRGKASINPFSSQAVAGDLAESEIYEDSEYDRDEGSDLSPAHRVRNQLKSPVERKGSVDSMEAFSPQPPPRRRTSGLGGELGQQRLAARRKSSVEGRSPDEEVRRERSCTVESVDNQRRHSARSREPQDSFCSADCLPGEGSPSHSRRPSSMALEIGRRSRSREQSISEMAAQDQGTDSRPYYMGRRTSHDSARSASSLSPIHSARKFEDMRVRRISTNEDGVFSSVYEGIHESEGFTMQVKQLEVAELNGSHVNVITELQQLRHPCLVSVLGFERASVHSPTILNIHMDFVCGSSVSQWILDSEGPLTTQLTWRFTIDMISGLQYLHSMQVVHGDIRGANVLISSDGRAKLADFGWFGISNRGLSEETFRWMAPEKIQQEKLSFASDIWSLGATTLEMITGKKPFSEYSTKEVYRLVGVQSRSPAVPKSVHVTLRDFIEYCHLPDPRDRPSAPELYSSVERIRAGDLVSRRSP